MVGLDRHHTMKAYRYRTSWSSHSGVPRGRFCSKVGCLLTQEDIKRPSTPQNLAANFRCCTGDQMRHLQNLWRRPIDGIMVNSRLSKRKSCLSSSKKIVSKNQDILDQGQPNLQIWHRQRLRLVLLMSGYEKSDQSGWLLPEPPIAEIR